MMLEKLIFEHLRSVQVLSPAAPVVFCLQWSYVSRVSQQKEVHSSNLSHLYTGFTSHLHHEITVVERSWQKLNMTAERSVYGRSKNTVTQWTEETECGYLQTLSETKVAAASAARTTQETNPNKMCKPQRTGQVWECFHFAVHRKRKQRSTTAAAAEQSDLRLEVWPLQTLKKMVKVSPK